MTSKQKITIPLQDFANILFCEVFGEKEAPENLPLQEFVDVLSTLTDKEEAVIRMKLGQNATDEEICKLLGIPFGRLSPDDPDYSPEVDPEKTHLDIIYRQALRKLRHPSRNKRIKPVA